MPGKGSHREGGQSRPVSWTPGRHTPPSSASLGAPGLRPSAPTQASAATTELTRPGPPPPAAHPPTAPRGVFVCFVKHTNTGSWAAKQMREIVHIVKERTVVFPWKVTPGF